MIFLWESYELFLEMPALWKTIQTGGDEMPFGLPSLKKLQSPLLPPLWI